MKPEILIRVEYSEPELDLLRRDFVVHHAPSAAAFAAAAEDVGANVRGVVTNGSFGISGTHIRAMPRLEIVLARGVGFEQIDIATAREQGVIVTNGQGVNSDAVADHAMALLLSAVRKVAADDRAIREGGWSRVRGPQPLAFGKRMGIIGLGGVGSAIARRARGFDMAVGYHGRRRQPDSPYEYFATPIELAGACEMLMVCCPGGPETRGLVNAAVLDALGSSGFLVNVARGSVVDADALAEALRTGRIAGAAIDVVEGEPAIPQALLEAPSLLMTPHTGGLAPEIVAASNERVREKLIAHFTGQTVSHRIA